MKVPEVLSKMSRGMLVARPHHKFYIADYKQIEARVLADSAGDTNKIQMYLDGVDTYKLQATNLYGVPLDQVTKPQRQGAKSGELAFQFGGGINAMATFSAVYDVSLRPLFDSVWASTSPVEKRKAIWSADKYQREHEHEEPLDYESSLVADVFKQRWRISNPVIAAYWTRIMAAAGIAASQPGVRVPCGGSVWEADAKFLRCWLPSGKAVVYPEYEVEVGADRYGNPTYELTYWGVKDGRYQCIRTYGGKLSENETQAKARAFLAAAIIRLRHEMPVLFHVHDELICEVPIWYTDRHFERFKYLCSVVEPWGVGVPIEIDAFESDRYGKG